MQNKFCLHDIQISAARSPNLVSVSIVAIVMLASVVRAQHESVNPGSDSLHNQALIENTALLRRLDSIRTADSLSQSQLFIELQSYKTTDNLKKQELLVRIDSLKNAETVRIAEQKERIDSLKKIVKGFPVVPFGDTLFYIYTKLGPFAPQSRAEAIIGKIADIAKDPFYTGDSLAAIMSDQTVDLVYKNTVLLSVTNNDALWMGTDKRSLATAEREEILHAIVQYRAETGWQTIMKEILLALLVLLALGVIIHFANKLHSWANAKISAARGVFIRDVSIRNYRLLTAANIANGLGVLNSVMRWVIILLAAYLALPVMFSIFPWTKGFADTLFGYVLNPAEKIALGVWYYLPKFFTIVVIIFVFWWVVKGLRFLKKAIESGDLRLPGFYPEWANSTYQIVRVLLFAFMIVVIFPYLPGSESPVFRGVTVFLGVLFTFGSSGSLSNLMSGLILTYMRAYKIGDRVQIGSVTGDIVGKNLLVTRLRTIKNEDVTIPNSTIMNSHTINYSSSAADLGLIVHTTVTIGYDTPWRTIHELLINAALSTNRIKPDPKPFVLQTSLNDFFVSYQINAYTKAPNEQATIYSDLHQNIQDKFFEAGVEIVSPHYTSVRDGNAAAIPPDHLPEHYSPPSFRVQHVNDKKTNERKE